VPRDLWAMKRSTVMWSLILKWAPYNAKQGNPAPEIQTYTSVVFRERVRIAFTLAALNDLDIQSADESKA
jgi:hypothetical protein